MNFRGSKAHPSRFAERQAVIFCEERALYHVTLMETTDPKKAANKASGGVALVQGAVAVPVYKATQKVSSGRLFYKVSTHVQTKVNSFDPRATNTTHTAQTTGTQVSGGG